MVSMKLLLYLSIGTIAMLIPIMIQVAWHEIKLWKSVPIAIALTIAGTAGTYLLFFVENHWVGGTSFYGAVFFVPIIFLMLSKLVRIPYGILIDMCAPAECAMLVIMKIQCFVSGCCSGKALYVNSMGETVYFPSQVIELIVAGLIGAILMILVYRKKNTGCIYSLYMIIYGASRLILNTFRADQTSFLLGMPPGHIWSILSVLLGSIWLIANCKAAAKEM